MVSKSIKDLLQRGNRVCVNDQPLYIKSIGEDQVVTVDEEEQEIVFSRKELIESLDLGYVSITAFSSRQMEVAENRLEIIRPIISGDDEKREIGEYAKEQGVSKATIYRWLNDFREGGEALSSLVPKDKVGWTRNKIK